MFTRIPKCEGGRRYHGAQQQHTLQQVIADAPLPDHCRGKRRRCIWPTLLKPAPLPMGRRLTAASIGSTRIATHRSQLAR